MNYKDELKKSPNKPNKNIIKTLSPSVMNNLLGKQRIGSNLHKKYSMQKLSIYNTQNKPDNSLSNNNIT